MGWCKGSTRQQAELNMQDMRGSTARTIRKQSKEAQDEVVKKLKETNELYTDV